MSERVVCGNCGGKIPLPSEYGKAKIRCGACGYYAEVPVELRSQIRDDGPLPKAAAEPAPSERIEPIPAKRSAKAKPKPARPPQAKPKVRARIDPRDTRPEFLPESDKGLPYLEGSQDEDDDKPYGVEGDGLMRCPDCQGELPLDATFCVHCGGHMGEEARARPKKKRRYSEIDEQFVEGYTLSTRLLIFGAMQLFNVFFSFTAVAATSFEVDAAAIFTGIFAGLFNTVLQAFIIGSFDTLHVLRNERGRTILTRTRRLLFVPVQPEVIDWTPCRGVGRLAENPGNIFAWLTCLYLLIVGCLPGILFWWFELRTLQSNVVLTNVYNGVEDTVFRTKDENESERVALLIAEATGLIYNRVV